NASSGYLLGSQGECFLNLLVRLDSSSKVNLKRSAGAYSMKHIGIDNLLGFGTVQIDEMKPLNTDSLEAFRHLQRIVVVFFFAAVVALTEADAFSSNEVDGGDDL